MKIIKSIVLLVFLTTTAMAGEKLLTAKSPKHRVALLELYTSEGCSSCPPADRFLSGLRNSGLNNQQLIPLAFHVTYWNYIGWKDPFAMAVHDDRQRKTAIINRSRSVYTPQFVFNGSDYRQYNSFNDDIRKINVQPAKVDIVLNVAKIEQQINIDIKTNASKIATDDLAFYVVLYENKLSSHVKKGENEGAILNHDYVVRKIYGPFKQDKSSTSSSFQQEINLDPQWKQQDMGIVAYAQNLASGEILQAVELELF